MRRGGAGLIAAVLALAGCKSADKPFGKEPAGTNASRPKGKDAKDGPKQKWLDPTAGLPGSTTGVPKAKSWGGDAKAAAQDAVGGKAVDASGRPAKNIFIAIRGVNEPPGAAPVGIHTDGDGYFFTNGLRPGQAYTLVAEATQEGKLLTGTVQTRVPNPVLTIVLREDGAPPASGDGARPAGADGFPPPPAEAEHIPPTGVGSPRTPRPTPGDSAFAPGNGATNPVPSGVGSPPGGSGLVPPVGPIPPPDDLNPTGRPPRPENVADGPRNPFAPPASIPGPPTLPNPAPPRDQPDRKQGVRPGANFLLLDSLERNWDFATDKAGSVVLLEFVTTSCPNCKPAVSVLRDLQSRYAADGLQVVAVLCDEVPLRQRAAAAAKYAKDNNTNYAVFVEPGVETGAVRDRYGVEGYPTAVLLDSTGIVLWKGHPAKRAEIEAAVRRAVGR